MARKYWLFKSEPNVYSIDHLERDGTTYWDGVRNYQARNFLRDEIQIGDGVLFYHSRVPPMAVVGTAKVSKAGYPDPTQFRSKSKYFDPDSDPSDPRWFVVDIEFESQFRRPVTLKELRGVAGLKQMVLLNRGRLSVQPVRSDEWRTILRLSRN